MPLDNLFIYSAPPDILGNEPRYRGPHRRTLNLLIEAGAQLEVIRQVMVDHLNDC